MAHVKPSINMPLPLAREPGLMPSDQDGVLSTPVLTRLPVWWGSVLLRSQLQHPCHRASTHTLHGPHSTGLVHRASKPLPAPAAGPLPAGLSPDSAPESEHQQAWKLLTPLQKHVQLFAFL